ncbi:MAG: hypothetical protein WCC74_01015 [Minisyncoccia bacterium]
MEENTKISKISQSNPVENSPITNAIQRVIFHNDNINYFVFKKTERIVTALYIISGFLSDTEPAKFAIKDIANTLLKDALNVSHRNTNSDQFSIILLKHFTNISFLINLVRNIGGVSNMNADILLEEINKVTEILLKTWSKSSSQSQIFNQDFFAVGGDIKEGDFNNISFFKNIITAGESFDNRENVQKDIKDSIKDRVLYNNTQQKSKGHLEIIKDKNDRQEVIIAMLKKDKILTIKDFAVRIRDCSEKTIQRELIALMTKGILKKEGVRRWSKYSLV